MKLKRGIVIGFFTAMMLCICACGASLEDETKERTKKKSKIENQFVVEINGKDYNLAKDFVEVVDDFVDDDIFVMNSMLIGYGNDGLYRKANIDISSPDFFYVTVDETINSVGLAEFRYSFNLIRYDGFTFSEEISREMKNVENEDELKFCVQGYKEAKGLYVDGEFVDIKSYKEEYQKLKDENVLLGEILEKDGEPLFYSDYLDAWSNAVLFITDIYMYEQTLTELEESLNNSSMLESFEDIFCLTLAHIDAYKKLEDGEIDWYGEVALNSEKVRFTYYTNDEASVQGIEDRIEKRMNPESNFGYEEEYEE